MEMSWIEMIVYVSLVGLSYFLLSRSNYDESAENNEAISFDIDESLKNPFVDDSDFYLE